MQRIKSKKKKTSEENFKNYTYKHENNKKLNQKYCWNKVLMVHIEDQVRHIIPLSRSLIYQLSAVPSERVGQTAGGKFKASRGLMRMKKIHLHNISVRWGASTNVGAVGSKPKDLLRWLMKITTPKNVSIYIK